MDGYLARRFSKDHLQWATLGVFLFVNIIVWLAVLRVDRHGVLTVAFLDVGQGDAIYIEAPNGNQMLIDGGPSSGVELRALGRVMPFWDRSIDVVLATHPDQDHIGGLSAVLEAFSVEKVVTTENTTDTGAYAEFEKEITIRHTERILARRSERIILDEGVVLEVLFPDRSTRGWETNTGSIVARLSYGDVSFLFTGDSPQVIEKYLSGKDGRRLHATVLKLGHHGSRTSSSRVFLSAVDPLYAVISAGFHNKYGHPHQEVIDLLNELKISFVSTADRGDLVFRTDGTNSVLR